MLPPLIIAQVTIAALNFFKCLQILPTMFFFFTLRKFVIRIWKNNAVTLHQTFRLLTNSIRQKIIILEQGQNCTLQKQGPGSILTSLTLPPSQAEERKGDYSRTSENVTSSCHFCRSLFFPSTIWVSSRD